MHKALTEKLHWDNVWNFIGARSHNVAPQLEDSPITRWMERAFATRLQPGRNFLEVGAGGSAWPAHVAQKFGATGWGVDISRPGLDQAASACAPGASVKLVEGDFFDRSLLPLGAFDVVYSGGFIEHFSDAGPVAERLLELCAPGGIVVTTVPNLAGTNGWLQRLVDRKLFEAHIVFTPRTLDAGHAAGRLEPVEPAHHLGVLDIGAVNFMRVESKMPRWVWRGTWFALSHARALGEWVARHGGPADGGRLWAPMIGGIYKARP